MGGARTGAQWTLAFERDLHLLALTTERRHEQRASEASPQCSGSGGRGPVASQRVVH
jgi:hypothetical protein